MRRGSNLCLSLPRRNTPRRQRPQQMVFCQYPEGVRFGEEEDDIARLVIGIAARNNEHIQVITSLTNALDDESVIERLAHTTSVDEVLELLAGKKA